MLQKSFNICYRFLELASVYCVVMAENRVESDCEEDINSAAGKLSSKGSYEDSDEDSMAGFEDDLDLEDCEEEYEASNEAVKSNGEVSAKRKRKRADPTKRKQIRRILREDELTEVTISAQKEERERLRRLELQRSLAAAAAGSAAVQGSKVVENLSSASGSKPSSPVAVDIREKKDSDHHVIVIDSDDEGETSSSYSSSTCCHSQTATENLNGDLIEIISSDSEVEIDESDDDDDESSNSTNLDYDNSGLHVDDSVNQLDLQGRVLVNVNHPADEEDIFLAPQVAKVIKPHQVGYKPRQEVVFRGWVVVGCISYCKILVSVVQRVDSVVYWISCHPVDEIP